MNLKWSPVASSVIDLTRARAAAGSRNSSTNFMLQSSSDSSDLGRVEGFDLVDVVGAHLLHLTQRQRGLAFVDLCHRKTDVHKHPITDLKVVVRQQAHADVAADAIDVDLGQRLFSVNDFDHLAGDSQTHRPTPFTSSQSFSADARQWVADEHVDNPAAAERSP